MNVQIVQALLDGLLMGGVYALAALGLSLIFGVMKITNFAHGAMMTMGMYTVYVLATSLGISPYLALPASMLVLFGVGYLIQSFCINKIMSAPSHNQLLLTLGISYVLENVILSVFSPNYKTLDIEELSRAWKMGEITVNPAKLIAFLVALVVTGVIYIVLYRTTVGFAIRATSQDRHGALLVGVPVGKVSAVAFGIGAMCTGIAGALLTPVLSIYPTIGETFQLKCFVIAVLGGMGNLWGALVSGFIVGIVEMLTGYFLGGSWSDLAIYLVFILVLVIKPTGLFEGRNRRES